MKMSFDDKVVLITGASSGIGAASAVEFAKNGANVAIVGRNVEKLRKVAEKCVNYRQPLLLKADISNDDEAKKMVADVIAAFGKVDVLVNNAGIICIGSILDGDILDAYDKVMKINVRSHINVTSLAAPYLVKSKGNVINVSSAAGSCTPRVDGVTAYNVSKAALNHFSRCAAKELASEGVRVNTVSPGPVKTDVLKNCGLAEVNFDDIAKDMPLKRMSESIEVADMILFLASDKAAGITGSEFLADNGYQLG